MVDPAIPPVEDSALPREQLVQKLTQKLVLRPDKGDLVEQNILKGNQFPLMQGLMFQDEKLSPMLQATSEALKKGQLADNLQKKIHHRPDKDDLVQQNILKDCKIAPSLQAVSVSVQKEFLAQHFEHKFETRLGMDEIIERSTILTGLSGTLEQREALEHKFDQRPEPEELRRQHILQDDGKLAPRLQPTASAIRKEMLISQLEHAIEFRPDKDMLIEHNILRHPANDEAPTLTAKENLEQLLPATKQPDAAEKEHTQ